VTIKKSLESRIRGWYPKEPTLPKISAKIVFPTKPATLPTQKPEGTVSATKVLGFLAILFAFIEIANIIGFRNLNSIPSSSQVGWIAVGLIFGFILTLIFTRRQLSRFGQDNKITINKKDTLTLVVPLIIFFISAGLASVIMYSFDTIIKHGFIGLLPSIYALAMSGFITRYVLFIVYEKRKNIILVQYWFGPGIFAVPKSGKISLINQVAGLEQ
jgi:hypothetical protein